MFHENLPKVGEKIFVDRDPKAFLEMLNFIRNDYVFTDESVVSRKKLEMELRYWELPV